MTIRYLLDTNIVSQLINEAQPRFELRLLNAGIDTVALSMVVVGEIEFGLALQPSARRERQLAALRTKLALLPVDEQVARAYGRLRADLKRSGTPIGANDLWIAAHALAIDATIVTANVGEFTRVSQLRVENWLE